MSTKDKIIATASKLFVEKGFEKTTMEDIASVLGINKGSLYYHIKSKADIFSEILDMSVNESEKTLRKIRRSKVGPEEKFERIIKQHFENIQTFSLEYQIVLNERRYMLNKKTEKKIRAKMKAYENHLYESLKDGMDAGVFRNDLNPRVIVVGIIGVGNALHKWFSFDGPYSFDEIVGIYLEFFINGIKKQN